jgi:type II secretory pathway pseudopilin PulG
VVIAIIGLLASIVLVSLNTAREKARDTRRLADLKQIQTALEMYYDDNGRYPPEAWCDSSIGSCGHSCPCGGSSWNESSSFYTSFVGGGYVSELPEDPINNATYYYAYEPTNDGAQGYFFRARLEKTGDWWGVCGGTYNSASWCH